MQTLVTECEQNEGLYKKTAWESFEPTLTTAKEAIKAGEVSDEVYNAFVEAKNTLEGNKREVTTGLVDDETPPPGPDNYNADDRFKFPNIGETKILEMEYCQLDNVNKNNWDLRVAADSSASNGMKVSGLDQSEDRLYLYYTAPRTGIYSVEYKYFSGNSANSFLLEGDKIRFDASTFVGNGQSDKDGANRYTGNFEIEVTEVGEGLINVVPGSSKAPTFDVMTITAKEVDLNVTITDPADDKGSITSNVENGTVRQGNSATFTITPDANFVVAGVTVNGKTVEGIKGENGVVTVTVDNVTEDLNVAATYEIFNYSEAEPFVFPTTAGESVTLEMEYLELNNNPEGDRGGDGHDYPVEVTEGDRNGNKFYFLNSLNNNDTAVLYYVAERPGTYTAVLTYRSGNNNNALTWSEADGKIKTATIQPGQTNYPQDHDYTFEFTVDKPGSGILTFAGSNQNAPQMDKIVITRNLATYAVTKNAGENGTISGPETVTEGEDATFAITPIEGYAVESVTVNGEEKGAVESITVENVTDNVTIAATFMKEAELKGYSAVLGGNIIMKFRFVLSQEVLDNNAKVKFTLGGAKVGEPIPVTDEAYDKESGCYIFECGVPAKDMATEIGVQVVLGDGRECLNYTCTVKGYVETLKKPEASASEKDIELATAMSEYGDFAAKYFTPEGENNAITAEMLQKIGKVDAGTQLKKYLDEAIIPEKGDDSIYYGTSLLLKSNTDIRHYFTENVTVVSVNGDTDVAKTYKTTQKGELKLWYVEYTGIEAHKLGDLVTMIVATEDGEQYTITYSPLTYAYIANTNTGVEENLQNLTKAMYLYHNAAQEYLGNK